MESSGAAVVAFVAAVAGAITLVAVTYRPPNVARAGSAGAGPQPTLPEVHQTPVPTRSPTRSPTLSPVPSPVLDVARLRAGIAAAVGQAAGHGITQHLVVIDRHTGRTISSVQPGTRVPALSVVKLYFAADVMNTAGGADRLDPDTRARLHTMIADSDDALASAFYSQGGGGQIIERVAARYHLAGTEPSPEPKYWGGIRTTAADLASFLTQALADPGTGPLLASAMRASGPIGSDGYHQDFGMNAIPDAGSKQGWGCCLGGVVGIHSVGFTDDVIVVVLSTAAPDAPGLNVPEVSAFADDPGFRASVASVASVTATARAATARPVLTPGPAASAAGR